MAEDINVLVMKVKSDGIKQGSNDLDKLTKSADKAEVAVKKLGTSIITLNSQTTSGTATAAAMVHAMERLTAQLVLLTTTQTRATAGTRAHNESMREAHALARGLTGSFGALWLTYGNFAGMAAGLAIGAGLKAIVTIGSDVEHTLEKIRVLGEATVEEIGKMRDVVYDLGQGVNGPKDVAEALSVLTLAGLDASESLAGVGAALSLAVAGDVSIEKSATTLVQVGTALGYTADGFDHIADVIAKTAAVSMSSVDSIAGAFKSAAAVGEVYGATLQDIGLGLAAVANLGIQGTAAGTALKNFYKDLASQAGKVVGTYKAMGMASADLKDDHGNFLPLINVIEKLDAGLSTLDKKVRGIAMDKIFGERGVKEGAALLKMWNTVSKELDDHGNLYKNKLVEVNDKIEKSFGFATMAAIAMSQTTKNQLKSVGNTLEVSFTQAFTDVQPQINAVARELKAAFSSTAFIDGIKAVAIAVANLTRFIVEHIKELTTLAGLLAGWKITMFVAGIVSAGQAFVVAAIGAKTFALALGPIAIAIMAMGAAWAYYNSQKDRSITNKDAQANLAEFVAATQKAADKEQEILRMRLANKTEAEIAAEQQMQADKEASDLAIKHSEKGIEKMKSQNAARLAAMSDTEKYYAKLALAKNASEDTMGDGWRDYVVGVRSITKAEEVHTYQVGISKAASDSLFTSRKANAEASNAAAAEAKRLMESGTGQLAAQEKSKASANERYMAALKAEEVAIKGYYRALRNTEENYTEDFRAGKIGKIQLINEVAEAEKVAATSAIAAIERQLDAARKAKKSEDVERFEGSLEKEQDNLAQAKIRGEKQVQSEIAALQRDATNQRIKMLESQGQFEKAATEKFSAEHSKAWESAQNDLDAYGDKYPELAAIIKDFENRQKQAIAGGKFKEMMAGFNGVAANTSNLLRGISNAAENNGMHNMWGKATEASEKYLDNMETLKVQQEALAEQAARTGNDADVKTAAEALKTMHDVAAQYKEMWIGIGNTIAEQLETAFGRGGKAMGGLVKATIAFDKISDKSAEAKVHYYGAAAGAAKDFFSEGSRGYKTLEGVSKVFHMAEMANTLGLINLKAIMAVLNQGSGDPYTAFARMAAMAAVVGALGYAVSGGFNKDAGGKSAEEMQKTQGTGGVFGDAEAKSDSIRASIEAMESTASLMLPLTSAMLNSLTNIEASMTGLTNLVIRSPGITSGTNFGIVTGQINKGQATDGIARWAERDTKHLFGGGKMGENIAKALNNLWGKTKTNIVDSGIQFGGNVNKLQSGIGYDEYASANTTKSSWLGLVKKTTNQMLTQGLSKELSSQMGLVFTNLEDALKLSAESFGKTGAEVTSIIDNLVIETTQLSLKGLDGEGIKDAINGVISKTMDTIAEKAFPGLENFRQVGEGYAQTVMRVASGIEQAQVALKEFGITAIDYTAVLEKTGDIAAQMVRQSIVGKESTTTAHEVTTSASAFAAAKQVTVFTTALTGVGEIMQGLTGTADELTGVYRELVAVRKSMADMGLGTGLSKETVIAAGGLDKLSSSVKTYYEKFFSVEERLKIETANVTASFVAIGKELPNSRAQLREWVTTAASIGDQSQVGKLLGLAEAYDSIAGAANDSTEAIEKTTAKRLSLEHELMELQGRGAEVTKAVRAAELEELNKLDPALKVIKQQIWDITDAVSAFKAAVTVVEGALKGLNASVDAEKKVVNTAYDESKKALDRKQDDESKALQEAHDDNVKAIQDRAELESTAADAALVVSKAANAAALKSANDVVTGAERLLGSLKAAIEDTSQYDQRSARAKALATVRGAASSSDAGNYAGIDDAIKELQKPSEAMFSTLVDYQLSQAEANAELRRLEEVASLQLTDAQAQVAILTRIEESLVSSSSAISAATADQITRAEGVFKLEQERLDERHKLEQDALIETRDAELKKLDEILNNAQLQLDAINGVDNSVKSLSEAMSLFSGSILAAVAAKADKEATIAGTLPSFDKGTNNLPYDMVAKVHKGERIIPPADNAELMRRLSSDESSANGAASNASLQATISELIEIIKIGDTANVQKTNELLKIIRDWDRTGTPETRLED